MIRINFGDLGFRSPIWISWLDKNGNLISGKMYVKGVYRSSEKGKVNIYYGSDASTSFSQRVATVYAKGCVDLCRGKNGVLYAITSNDPDEPIVESRAMKLLMRFTNELLRVLKYKQITFE